MRFLADENHPTPAICEATRCTMTPGSPNVTCAALACTCGDTCATCERPAATNLPVGEAGLWAVRGVSRH